MTESHKQSVRVSKEALTTVGIWHENNKNKRNTNLYLAEIPLSLHKLNIINSMHLLELEKLFEEICL